MAAEDKKPSFSRVFFIGAGFSAGMQYPVGRTLMSHLVNYLKRGPIQKELNDLGFINVLARSAVHRDRADQIVKIIEQVLRKYFATDKVDQVDVAEFFTIAHTLAQTPLLFGPSEIERDMATSEESEEAPSEATLFEDLAAVTRTYFTAIGKLDHRRDDIIDLHLNWFTTSATRCQVCWALV